jgi:DNA-binding NarL/FixJ family response regulator
MQRTNANPAALYDSDPGLLNRDLLKPDDATMPNDAPVSVYLVDDQAMLRAAFKSLLKQTPGFSVAGEAGDARAAMEEVKRLRPDVVLLDITMPGLSGIDALPKMREMSPKTRFLMVTHHEGESFVKDALERGADGYLSKDSDPEELAMAIRSVVRGQPFISPKVARGVLAAPGSSAGSSSGVRSLTGREREVFLLLAIGRSNKEVARQLTISLGTAKKHRENLQRKLDCHSTADLARLAIREGLLGA